MSVSEIRPNITVQTEAPQMQRATQLESQPLRLARVLSNVGIRVGKTKLAIQRGRETVQHARPLLTQRAALILNTEHARGQARCNALLDNLSDEVERRQAEYLATCKELGLIDETPTVS